MTNENQEQPTAKLTDGEISATLWMFDIYGLMYVCQTTIARTYQDSDGEYHETNTFSGTDLLRVARLAEMAYELELSLKAEAYANRS